jgi:hypothetical protein
MLAVVYLSVPKWDPDLFPEDRLSGNVTRGQTQVTALTTLVGQEVLDSQSRRALSSGTFTRPALRARGG